MKLEDINEENWKEEKKELGVAIGEIIRATRLNKNIEGLN